MGDAGETGEDSRPEVKNGEYGEPVRNIVDDE